MNITSAIAVAKALEIDVNVIQKAVSELKSPPGRIEFISEAEQFGFKVIVDYAFEPGALKALYDVVDLLKPQSRIIHVCGSTGGGRDKARRVPIGEFVGKKADVFFVTDEDPYDEDPMEIIKTVSQGAQNVGKKLGENLFEILDRKDAIEKAIQTAQPGDLVLITGKGSEQGMCVAGGKMIAWDDREIVRNSLKSLKSKVHKV
jgi:UDP-N-acetylmuramyl tripeptide synthase